MDLSGFKERRNQSMANFIILCADEYSGFATSIRSFSSVLNDVCGVFRVPYDDRSANIGFLSFSIGYACLCLFVIFISGLSRWRCTRDGQGDSNAY